MSNKRKIIYDKAIKRFGRETQVVVALEELSELSVVLAKMLCGKLPPKKNRNLIDELADAKIMIEQLEHIFDCKDDVNAHIYRKINRLDDRLKELDNEQ